MTTQDMRLAQPTGTAVESRNPVGPTETAAATTSADGEARLAAQIAWAISDGARSPYTSLIALFVFSAYFTTVVAHDPVQGQTLWSFVVATAALILAVGAPILGPIADAGGRVKPWLAAFVALGLPCIAALWFATPHMQGPGLYWILAALVGAKISVEYSNIFVNALLPRIVPRHKVGFLSGMGLVSSNITIVIVLLTYLFGWSWNPHPLFGLDAARYEPQRATGPLTALWFGLLSLPVLLWTPDAPRTALTRGQAVRAGLASLAGSIRKARENRTAALFLLSRMIYNEGSIVLMMFTGIFAAGVLKWTPVMLVVLGLFNCVGGILAGFGAGWLDQRIGSKRTTVLFIAIGLLTNLTLCSVTPDRILWLIPLAQGAGGGLFPHTVDKIFICVSMLVAISVTGSFSSSRALMAKLAPPHMRADFFSLYALSGTVTSFAGPLAIGIMTSVFQSQRAGISVGVVFFFAGLLVLLRVREDEVHS